MLIKLWFKKFSTPHRSRYKQQLQNAYRTEFSILQTCKFTSKQITQTAGEALIGNILPTEIDQVT